MCPVKNRKRALCSFDDKRFLLADGLHTLAFGHAELTAAIEPVECMAHPTAIAASLIRMPGTQRRPATGVDPADSEAAAAAAAALAQADEAAPIAIPALIDFHDLIGGAGVDDDEAAQEADYINALVGDEEGL